MVDHSDSPSPEGADGVVAADASSDRGAKPSAKRHQHSSHVSRRRFIGLSAAGAAVTAAAAVAITHSVSGDDSQANQGARPPARAASDRGGPRLSPGTTAPVGDTVTATRSANGVLLPTSEAIIAENAKPGHLWWVTTPQAAGDIEGYADQVSTTAGSTVNLFVSTKAASFHVEAYRMGYYGGIGGRLVWQSDEIPGSRQPPPTLVPFTYTIQCQWAPSLAVPVDVTWPPGTYLLKLVGATGEQQFVPLCVRDDASKAAIVIQQSVTTWQAYNRWGGYSLYYGNRNGALSFTHVPSGGSFAERSRVVSFDRPYDHDWASGAADFVGNELPVIYQAEQLGLDVTYWTDIDLHAQPQLLTSHKGLISLGHDEYWSAPMRDGVTQALAAGVNLAFLGANACYRQIRFEPSPLGANRLQVCYKSAAEDPMFRQNPALVTVNWPQAPVSRPESELIGSTYQDIGAKADLVIADPTSWVLAGVELPLDHHFADVVQGEFDRYVPGAGGPANLDIIAHSLVANRGGNYSDMTWYTVPGGGGVFATGNANWLNVMSNSSLVPSNVIPDATPGSTAEVLRMMENVYSVIGGGPASVSHPSQGNWTTTYAAGSPSTAAPNTINAA